MGMWTISLSVPESIALEASWASGTVRTWRLGETFLPHPRIELLIIQLAASHISDWAIMARK
jgi:hypothetical protein